MSKIREMGEEEINGGRVVENGKEEEGKKGEGGATVPFHKLFAFADPLDYLLMFLGTIGALANGLSLPLMTVIFGQMINSFGLTDSKSVLSTVSGVALNFVYLGIGTSIGSFLELTCWMITGDRQAARIRGLYLKAILRLEIAFFDKETNTGEVVGRMSGDTVLIQDAMGEKVGKFIQLLSTFIAGFIIAFVKGWLLALVLLSSIPLVVAAGGVMSLIVSKLSTRGQTAYAEAGNVVEQTIGSIRTVASFTGEKMAIENYNKSLKTAYLATVQQGAATGLGLGCVFFTVFCSYALGMWYGSRLIISRGYSGGDVVTVLFALMTGGMSLGQASPCVTAFAAGTAAAHKMFLTIQRLPEIDPFDKSGLELEDVRGEVELRDVHFSYPARPEVAIFSGFSLRVPSGKIVALVGESGSGKSTVISLIERFYDPSAGEVLIDGVNMKALRIGWIREKIGLVSQEPVLFSTTIKENILYGKAGATLEEIKKAAELANAMKFIDKLPQGLDTMVGEHGTQLSGGQKQRIAIARAILKNPRILLLDEATSALDAESERVVQDALSNIMVDRTTVVVAHRLSTIRNADLIAVVYRGQVVEKGSHSELLKDPEGAYSQLIRLQEINRKEQETHAEEHDPDELIDGSVISSRSASQRHSLSRSISRGSNRHSFNMSYALPVAGGFGGSVVDDGDEEAVLSKKPEQNVPLGRLAALNKPEIPILLLGSIAAAINGSIFPILGLVLSSIISTFFEPHDQLRKDADFWALMYIVLGIVSLLVQPAQTYLFGVAGGRLIWRIRALSFEKVVYQEISWFDQSENSSGAVGARLSADASTVRALVGDSLSVNIQNLATIVAGLLIAFTAYWALALIILALVPLIGLQGFVQMKFMKGFSEDAKVMYEEASQVANDAVSSIRTVASFCAEQKVMDLYEIKCEAPRKSGIRQGVISGLGFGFSFFVLFCSYALSFYAGARLVADGKTTFNNVFKVFFALIMTAIGASQTSALAPDAAKAKAATASIFNILDRKSKIDSSEDGGETLNNVKADIEFQHVSFHYPTRPNVQIFRDLSLSVPSGKTVALVGESGSGKSTVISLLERFYDPNSGKILLDGIEIQNFQLRWLRQQMGLVSQEPILFNDTIRANISYGKPGNVSEEEIIKVAKAANAHEFISAMPQGYDTTVGERGIQMSGGQKQRIAIARAMVKDPKVLLLDEATSALDAESERLVQETLDSVMVNRTTIVVAHRLSTIRGVDVIAVVKNGMIAEMGGHDTLINIKGGLYASLVALQMSAAAASS